MMGIGKVGSLFDKNKEPSECFGVQGPGYGYGGTKIPTMSYYSLEWNTMVFQAPILWGAFRERGREQPLSSPEDRGWERERSRARERER